jgi:NitT/TauT family transport system permease protein
VPGCSGSPRFLVAALWELYKALGPEEGGAVFGRGVLPRTSDQAMPPASGWSPTTPTGTSPCGS